MDISFNTELNKYHAERRLKKEKKENNYQEVMFFLKCSLFINMLVLAGLIIIVMGG